MVMTDSFGVTSYQYDDLYRLITVTNPFTGVVGYRYDDADNRVRLIYPDEREVLYDHNGDNQIIQVDDWEAGETTYEYDLAGRLITTTLPNGVITVNEYDLADRLTRLTHRDSATAELLADYQYELDGVGGRQTATETLRLPDTVERLTSTDGKWAQAPATAYNEDQDAYLVVWQKEQGPGWQIYGRQIAGDGTLIGDPFYIGDGLAPSTAYSPDENAYLVVWQAGRDIWGRLVVADGSLEEPFRVYDTSPFVPAGQPDVAYSTTTKRFLVFWKEATMIETPLIRARTVAHQGEELGEVMTLASSFDIGEPAVAAADDGRFLVVWRDGRNKSDDIYGYVFNEKADAETGPFAIASSFADETTPDVAWNEAAGRYLVIWRNDHPFLYDRHIQGRRLTASGGFVGSPITIDNDPNVAAPALTDVTNNWLITWQQGASSEDLYGRFMHADGSLGEDVLGLVTAVDDQTLPTVVGGNVNGEYLLAWQDGRKENPAIYSQLFGQDSWQTTSINYTYDPLYQLTEAAYSGALSGVYTYEYDAAGNRINYTTNITTSQVITYGYDTADRLAASVDLTNNGEVTAYEWDDANRLITTTVAGEVTKLYQYSQAGDLIVATVNNLVTTFAYDGDGGRLQLMVEGVATTYTLDYAGRGQVLLEYGSAFADTKHYLYGDACIGEQVDAGLASEEWRYYQHDGSKLVRQTTDRAANVTLAWAYSPTGMVLLGEKGPVTHLGCEGDAIYDWSTGLIFKNGQYFDPTNGIWLTLSGAVVYQAKLYPKRKWSKGKKRFYMLFLLIFITLILVGCGGVENECPQEPQEVLFPDKIFDAQIKSSTVIISFVDRNSIASSGLATVVNGGDTLMTHNHFSHQPNAEYLVIETQINNIVEDIFI